MQKRQLDFVVVGGGIAGVAVGAELARRGDVLAPGARDEPCLPYDGALIIGDEAREGKL